MDTDALMAAVRASYTRYERNRGLTIRKRRAAAAVLFADIHADAQRLAAAELDAARAQQRTIRDLDHVIDGLRKREKNREKVTEALRDEVTELRAELLGHVCEPLPQRVSAILDAPPEPNAATEVPAGGPRKAAKPRTARSAGTGKAGTAQSRTEPRTGGAA